MNYKCELNFKKCPSGTKKILEYKTKNHNKKYFSIIIVGDI